MTGRELEFEDRFTTLDRWYPHYLPHWSSSAATAARLRTGNGLTLRIDADQDPWCPEFDGDTRVSGLQTALTEGQSKFRPDLVVREPQTEVRLYTPTYGRFEIRCKAVDDPNCMVALWMIGLEDVPERSAEICIAEIFGKHVYPAATGVGMGLHPFGDPRIKDEFEVVDVPIDGREFHVYGADWQPGRVDFFVDDELVNTVMQAPDYPMQFQLAIFEFGQERAGRYPKEFEVEWFRAYR
ncbi:glycoside hydrolase family 16 protein [Lentzea sp. PSKA42]|uniref:Glycoside hydrolase family 16 protein n=1 Tax=Lentzea indica TaxID=2604800 RepID=A0ABX1FMR2_9PSEU|nr:glycoside hydrolase family 16 protein [Lentzea indica]NKE60273.1 glycoside hydrolase family 16 protein [Lentzea indica]